MDAGKMGWLTFSHSFRPKMAKLIRDSLECTLCVVQEFQQRESMRFMALFNQKIMVGDPGQTPHGRAEEGKRGAVCVGWGG